MSQQEDQAYFARRREEETRRSDTAPTPEIAAIHRKLAKRYSQLCGDKDAGGPAEGQKGRI